MSIYLFDTQSFTNEKYISKYSNQCLESQLKYVSFVSSELEIVFNPFFSGTLNSQKTSNFSSQFRDGKSLIN